MLVTVLTLALGVGVATAMFVVVDGVLVERLPVEQQDRLLVVWKTAPDRGPQHLPFAYASIDGMRQRVRTAAGVAAHVYAGTFPVTVTLETEPMPTRLTSVTGNWFDVLGVRPQVGRLLQPADDVVGAPPVAVLSSALAERLFGADPNRAVGRVLRLDEGSVTVVGVLPPDFDFPRGAAVWVPSVRFRDSTNVAWDLLVRVARPFTVEQARSDLGVAFATLSTESSVFGRQVIGSSSYVESIVGDIRPRLLMLTAVVLLVLVAAGVNVANLLLSEWLVRHREMAVRTALGAARGRIVRQLAAEMFVIAVATAVAASLIAAAGLKVLLAVAPADIPRLATLTIDGWSIVFTSIAAVGMVFAFGMLPTVFSVPTHPNRALHASSDADPRTLRYRLRHGLVIAQVAIAALVLSTAGVLLRSLGALEQLDVGFSPDSVALVEVTIPPSRVSQVSELQQIMMQVATRVAEVPGVNAASAIYTHPFAGSVGADIAVYAEGQMFDPSNNPLVNYEGADPMYFATLGVPLLGGRLIGPDDRAETQPVVVVNETFARLFWSGANPVGRRIKWGGVASTSPWRTVIGVVADTRYRELTTIRPTVYVPYGQGIPIQPRYIAVRTASLGAVTDAIRRAIAAQEPAATVLTITPLPALLDAPLVRPRFQSALAMSFALLGFTLAVLGTYAVTVFFVRTRARDIGIRLALGADRRTIRRLILGQGVAMAATGLLVGLSGAIVAARWLQPLLFQVSALDPVVLGATAATIAIAVCGATLPSLRLASRMDPLTVIRAE